MSFSHDNSEKPKSSTHDAGAYSAWGLIIGGSVGLVPALLLGGRMYAIAAGLACLGWLVGALIDRAER